MRRDLAAVRELITPTGATLASLSQHFTRHLWLMSSSAGWTNGGFVDFLRQWIVGNSLTGRSNPPPPSGPFHPPRNSPEMAFPSSKRRLSPTSTP